jgi:CMP-N-acetylneuraminic acid synthetase
MTSVCVIPARRDSKRIPAKMLRTLAGRTLVERAVASVLASRVFDVVVLSTEDEEIRSEACGYEDLVLHTRAPKMLGDTVGAAEITLAACEHVRAERDIDIDVVGCLAPAYPLRSAASIRAAYRAFVGADAGYLMSAVMTDPHHFHWAMRPEGEYASLYFGGKYLKDRAFLPPILSPTGAIKLGRLSRLATDGYFFGEKLIPFMMTREESLYVGDDLDLAMAELIVSRHGDPLSALEYRPSSV